MSHCYVFFISFDYIINGISMILLIKIYIPCVNACVDHIPLLLSHKVINDGEDGSFKGSHHSQIHPPCQLQI